MGSGSFLSKMWTYDPLTQLGVNKYVDPVANHFFDNYSKSSGPGTPGPYAGVAPSLAAANAGYGTGGPGAAVGVTGVPQNTYAMAAQKASAQPTTGAASTNTLFAGQPQQPGVNPVSPVQRPIQPVGGFRGY